MFTSLLRALVVAVALAPMTLPTPVEASGGGGRNQVKVEGVIIGINPTARVVVLRRFNGATIRIQLVPGTKLERNDIHVRLNAFRGGDRGEAVFVNGVVVKFEARGR